MIEYNGRQHYEEVKTWGGESGLNEVRRRDELKRIFFKSNQIRFYGYPDNQPNQVLK